MGNGKWEMGNGKWEIYYVKMSEDFSIVKPSVIPAQAGIKQYWLS